MSIYKEIKPSDISVVPIQTHKSFNLNTGSNGITSFQFRSGSDNLSGSYWESLRVNFYLSGSDLSTEDGRFNNPHHSRVMDNPTNKQHSNKFHSSGSVLSIPQKYFGEEIKQGSFKLTDNSTSKEIVIRDDGFGNLYSVGASITSSNNSISSSDNYVGNIFYKNGVVNITETGSYSASISYTDVTTGNYTLDFESTQTIFVREYTLKINPNEFNSTNNPTAAAYVSGSKLLRANLTGSNWSAYMNTIGFYSGDDSYPVMVARYPQPIKMRDDMTLIFKIRQDI
tara:strand:- start:2630 stop:3478 length:849 start_codon:yes stop_codon:yes gene_type:complete